MAEAVTVRYYAAARAAAGVEREVLTVPAGCTVEALGELLAARHEALSGVLARCSFLLDEVAVRDRALTVPAGSTVDVLPPFAGG